MKWFNNILAKVVPIMPKWSVSLVAKKYIAGVTLEETIQEIKKLNAYNFLATADVLGENIPDIESAEKPVNYYLELLDSLKKEQLNSGISVKLSQLGLTIDEQKAWKNFQKVLTKAKENDIFLRIDMEDSPWTDKTIGFYQRARDE